VGHVYARYAESLLDAANLEAHLVPQLGVQVGQRLVEQQHLRPVDYGPRQGDALLLPAGQLVRTALGHGAQTHHVHDPGCLLADHGLGASLQLEPEGYILHDGHVRKDGVALEYH
jgi:hypothetical protein